MGEAASGQGQAHLVGGLVGKDGYPTDAPLEILSGQSSCNSDCPLE